MSPSTLSFLSLSLFHLMPLIVPITYFEDLSLSLTLPLVFHHLPPCSSSSCSHAHTASSIFQRNDRLSQYIAGLLETLPFPLVASDIFPHVRPSVLTHTPPALLLTKVVVLKKKKKRCECWETFASVEYSHLPMKARNS